MTFQGCCQLYSSKDPVMKTMYVPSALKFEVFTVLRVNDILFCNLRPKKRNCFVSCNGPKKNRVCRSVKKNNFALFFWSKMCVLCMFHDDWELGGQKKL